MSLKRILIVNETGGFNLLSVLVTTVLTVGLAYAMTTLGVQILSATKTAIQMAALEEIRNHLRLSLDCEATAAARVLPCASGTLINLVGVNGVLVPIAGSRIGSYSLRASCRNDVDIQIEYTEDPAKLTGWKSLFAAVPLSC